MGIITAYRKGEITEEEFKKIINGITFKEKVSISDNTRNGDIAEEEYQKFVKQIKIKDK